MTTHQGQWAAGTPCWVDLSVNDVGRSQAFYAAVLGWEFSDRAEDYGGYSNAFVNGYRVAGMSPPAEAEEYRSSVWSVYLASDDADATSRLVDQAGGSVVFPVTHIEPHGKMAVFTDPTGAVFGVWQADKHSGYELSNEPGAVTWCEGMVGDLAQAKAFYASVFGYTYTELPSGANDYAMFTVPGGARPAGGLGAIQPEHRLGWTVTFEVADVDAAVRRLIQVDGEVIAEPFDFDYGRLAICRGPDNETFGIVTSNAAMG
jgi:predicted enzyme related to lactoylglutathione lyase